MKLLAHWKNATGDYIYSEFLGAHLIHLKKIPAQHMRRHTGVSPRVSFPCTGEQGAGSRSFHLSAEGLRLRPQHREPPALVGCWPPAARLLHRQNSRVCPCLALFSILVLLWFLQKWLLITLCFLNVCILQATEAAPLNNALCLLSAWPMLAVHLLGRGCCGLLVSTRNSTEMFCFSGCMYTSY